jgi:D-alanine transaminase
MTSKYDTVYLNGAYLLLSEAKISVLDRGFLFGDSIYEVIPAYSGKLFLLEEHLARLNNSLEGIQLLSPHSDQEWEDILAPLLTDDPDQYIYLQITRGVASKRDHAFPEDVKPTTFAMCAPIAFFTGRDAGVKAITLDDNRWKSCNIKATSLLANILLRQQAVEQDCAEAILVKDGYVTEGAASNIFAVIDGVLITPPNNHEILSGITRELIIKLAKNNQIPVTVQTIPLSAFLAASEIWLTSSTREILPVVELDQKPVADGKPGSVWKSMNTLFQAFKNSPV